MPQRRVFRDGASPAALGSRYAIRTDSEKGTRCSDQGKPILLMALDGLEYTRIVQVGVI